MLVCTKHQCMNWFRTNLNVASVSPNCVSAFVCGSWISNSNQIKKCPVLVFGWFISAHFSPPLINFHLKKEAFFRMNKCDMPLEITFLRFTIRNLTMALAIKWQGIFAFNWRIEEIKVFQWFLDNDSRWWLGTEKI